MNQNKFKTTDMKKSIVTAIAALCLLGAVDANAQGYHGQGRPHRPERAYFGRNGIELSVGYLHSNYKHKDYTSEKTENDKGLNGLYLGLTKDFTLIRRALYFQTGATYAYQNAANRFDYGALRVVSDRSEHYVDIPARLKLAMDVAPRLRVFVSAGPTMNLGISSKLQYRAKVADNSVAKTTYNYYSGKVKADLKGHELPMENPSSAYRRFDVGMGFEAGVLIHEVAVLKLGLDWGLINKNKNRTVADYLITHRNTFHLGLGVRF